MSRAAIGLGSNVGDRLEHLRAAVAGLRRRGEVMAVSSLYETEPVAAPGGDYLNAVVVLETDLSPQQLLEEMLELERAAGRRRRERWEPRTLDLDLLLYDEETLDLPGLTVPHPRLGERRFVLEPLAEVWPEATLPDGRTVASLLPGLLHQESVRTAGPEWAE